MVPKTLSGDPQVSNHGHRLVFAFLPLLLSPLLGAFQGPHDVGDHDRLSAESDTSLHLSSVKSEIKEICKNVK